MKEKEEAAKQRQQKFDLDKWKRIGNAFLFPHVLVKIILIILSALSMYYAFGTENPDLVISCAGYAVSAYTLVVICAGVPAIVKKVKARLYKNKYCKQFLTDREHRAKISLYTGVGISIIFVCIKLVAGYYYKSYWLAGIGIYYMVISLMRFALLRGERLGAKAENELEHRMYGLKCYRICGLSMFLLNIAVSGLVIQLIWKNETYSYPGILIFAFAAYAFYSFIMAVINVGRYRKLVYPVFSAAKMLSLASAMVSILALQTALLTEFSEAGQENFARIMNSATGSVVCFMIFGMAVWMIRRADGEMKKLEK